VVREGLEDVTDSRHDRLSQDLLHGPAVRLWARIETLSQGISTLRLPPEVALAWKEDLAQIGLSAERTVAHPPRSAA
jgi:hypothetical protein